MIPNYPGAFNNNIPIGNNPLQYDPMQEMDYQTEVLNITKIKEGLYIGDQIAATNLDVVIQFKLTHMINSTGKQIINAWETIGIKYLTLNWQESPSQNLFDSLDEIANKIVDFIEDSFNKGEGLLAYSARGQNRVCIVILIYLMKKYKWPLNKCLEFLRNRKQDIDIPNYFMEQLKNFEGRMIKRGEGIINIPWSEENLPSADERLMRNTYVNGLKSEVYNAKIVPSEMKKKNHIAWADFNPIKKQNLEVINLNKDLFFQKDIKNILNHKKMRPSHSCMKGKRKLYDDDTFEEKRFDGNRTMSENPGKMKFMEGNVFNSDMMNNIKTLNPNNQNMNYNINNFQNINSKINYSGMMKNNFINNNNKENNQINIVNNPQNIQQKINMNNNKKNYEIPLQTGKQNNIFVNTNNIYNDELENLPFNYTQMYNNFKNNNNKNISNNNQRINMQNNPPKKTNNQNEIKNNNFNNTYSVPIQKNSPLINNNNNNQNINYRGNIVNNTTSINSKNMKNYPNFKENIYMDNQNNEKGKIIYAEKYEQIVNNNIHNIIINQEPNKQEMKKIKNIKNAMNNNIDSEIGPIPNINFNQTSASMNFTGDNFGYYMNQTNNKMNKSQNIKNPQNIISKNNENQKNLNIHNIFNMNKDDFQNGKMNAFTGNKDQKFRPSDYTNNNINKNNNFMNYTPIHRQQDFLNNNNQKQDSYLDFRNNQNQNKPINNFNPSLMKKSSSNNSIKNPNLHNNNRKGNLYNRPRSQNGPVKIKNDIIRKPTTPDQINHYKGNNNNPLNPRFNNYGGIQRSINYGSKTPTRNDNNIHNRPSTAPQKEKNNSLYGNNINNNKYGNIRRSVNNNNMSGPTKRLPSPQIHSNNTLNRPQKNNPRYRAPSPVIRSNNNLNSMGIGTIKRSAGNQIHNKIF